MLRSLYVVIGLLLGIILVTKTAEKGYAALDGYWEKENQIMTLTAYYEGLDRGKYHKFGFMQQMLFHCWNELDHSEGRGSK